MKSLLAGIASGIALGILFAPRRGEQTRLQLRRKAAEFGDHARDQAERLRRGDVVQQAGSFAREAANQVRDTTSQIKDAAQRIVGNAGLGPLAMLNTASREELMNVRGIGPVFAELDSPVREREDRRSLR